VVEAVAEGVSMPVADMEGPAVAVGEREGEAVEEAVDVLERDGVSALVDEAEGD